MIRSSVLLLVSFVYIYVNRERGLIGSGNHGSRNSSLICNSICLICLAILKIYLFQTIMSSITVIQTLTLLPATWVNVYVKDMFRPVGGKSSSLSIIVLVLIVFHSLVSSLNNNNKIPRIREIHKPTLHCGWSAAFSFNIIQIQLTSHA